MRKFVLVSLIVAVLAGVSAAQDTTPAFDVFGGYSYLNTENLAPGLDASGHGWEAAVTGHLNNWVGVTGDFDGHYSDFLGVNVSTYNFLFGPTISYRKPKLTPYGHALFGASRVSIDLGLLGPLGASATDTAFAMALGGGADWHVGEKWSVRVAQLDYLMTRFASTSQNNLRFSTGLVFRFGSR
jgi:opacity protein-like surface antigen